MHDLSDVRAGHTCGRIITRHHLSSSTKMAYAKYDFLPRDADFLRHLQRNRDRGRSRGGVHIYIYICTFICI